MNQQKTQFEIAHEIVAFAIAELDKYGFKPSSVDSIDDEGEERTETAEAMLEEAFAMDEAALYFQRPVDHQRGWIHAIAENGEDVLSDWPAMGEFAECMEKVSAELEHLRCNTCLKIFKEPNAIEVKERFGEPEGFPDGHVRIFLHCPHCGSEDLRSVIAPPAE